MLHELPDTEGVKLFVTVKQQHAALAAAVSERLGHSTREMCLLQLTLDLWPHHALVRVVTLPDDHDLITKEAVLTSSTSAALFDTRDLSRPLARHENVYVLK